MTTGEPHIDGEPGDLRFRIKVLKYEWDFSGVRLICIPSISSVAYSNTVCGFFCFQTSCVWTQRRRSIHKRHHLSGGGVSRLWAGHSTFGWTQGDSFRLFGKRWENLPYHLNSFSLNQTADISGPWKVLYNTVKNIFLMLDIIHWMVWMNMSNRST